MFQDTLAPLHETVTNAILGAQEEAHALVEREETGQALGVTRVGRPQQVLAKVRCEVFLVLHCNGIRSLNQIEPPPKPPARCLGVAERLSHTNAVSVHDKLNSTGAEGRLLEATVARLHDARHVQVPHGIGNFAFTHLRLQLTEHARGPDVHGQADHVLHGSPELISQPSFGSGMLRFSAITVGIVRHRILVDTRVSKLVGQAAAVYGGKLQEVTTEDNARTTKAEICTTLGLAHPGIRLLQLLCGHHGDLVHEHRHGRGPTLAVSLQDLRAQATCALVQILQRQLAQCMDGVALQQPCRRIGNSALPDRLWAGKVVDERLGAA